ncbi:MAG TPA: hydrogenase expression/formation protein HypE [Actinomycetota bacterium]|nr:hydrogenase expression/formation protein HypE [Actinomycetota bacterium]
MSEPDAAFVMSCPVPLPPGEHVLLGHGSGGKLTRELISDLFAPVLGDAELSRLGDAAVVELPGGDRLAFTTDAFVVQPAFFPGSNIGVLAVNGTVNDLAMMGARPLALATALILEEGLEMAALGTVVAGIAEACRAAGVRPVTGDTKVVERGAADGLYVITSGIGVIPAEVDIGPERARPGDRVLVTGPIGSHGVAVMSRRAGIAFDADVRSDTAPLTDLAEAMIGAGEVRALRDATRGGVASVLNELAEASGVSITVDEAAFPMLPPVKAACEMLGLDPLYVANEGVAVAVVAAADTDAVLAAARSTPPGSRAAIVGDVGELEGGQPVRLRTGLGATRPLLLLAGDQLPRIC